MEAPPGEDCEHRHCVEEREERGGGSRVGLWDGVLVTFGVRGEGEEGVELEGPTIGVGPFLVGVGVGEVDNI